MLGIDQSAKDKVLDILETVPRFEQSSFDMVQVPYPILKDLMDEFEGIEDLIKSTEEELNDAHKFSYETQKEVERMEERIRELESQVESQNISETH